MAANQPEPSRLLSIQSHVVSGYVGNRSATFPLQLLGWDVDVINTVQFSNHTGYGRWQGQRFDESHVRSLFAGLERNGLLKQSRMLSGYMPSPGVVQAVKDAVEEIRKHSPDLVYLCDPVMGDMGRGAYVDIAVLPVYKSMLPLTTIITPNQFEAQALSGIDITDLPSLLRVLTSLHNQGASHVLITSVELPTSDLQKIGATSTLPLANGSQVSAMTLVGSSVSRQPASKEHSEPTLEPWFIQFPEIPGYFSGVGDLFAALTLGRFQSPSSSSSSSSSSSDSSPSITPIARAAELAIASVQGVLAKTMEATAQTPAIELASFSFSTSEEAAAQEKVETMRRRELRIIQSRKELEQPSVQYRAQRIPKGPMLPAQP